MMTETNTLTQANNYFGMQLLQRLVKHEKENHNIVLSPLQVSSLLAMLTLGASGDTLKEMNKILHYDGMRSEEDLKRMYNDLITNTMKGDSSIHMLLNHSVWYRNDMDVKKEWTDMVKNVFHGTATVLKSVDDVNEWVSNHTGRRIDGILKDMPKDVGLLLLGASYIQGKWSVSFDKGSTRDMPFHGKGGDRNVKMMMRNGNFRYLEYSSIQGIELPLGRQGRFSVVVLLPPRGNDLNDFINHISMEHWYNWMKGFNNRRGTLYLPRMLLQYNGHSLSALLKDMGLRHAFDGGFDRIGRDARLSDVLIKNVLELNEEGFEGASAEGAPVVRRMEAPMSDEERGFEMKVDRPYLLAIRDMKNEDLIFISRVENPMHQG